MATNQFSKGLVPSFGLEVAKGSVFQHGHFILGLCNQDVGTTEESVIQAGGIQNYSTSVAEMFLSSSSASDVNNVIAVSGINADLDLETRVFLTNGQTAVTTGTWWRILQLRNLGLPAGAGDLLGDLYIAESDTLVSGVPATASKVRVTIMFDSAASRSPNVGLGAGFTVPRDHIALILSIKFAAPNAKDVVFSTLLRPNNDDATIIRPFQDAAPFNLFQSAQNLNFDGIFVDELWDVEIRARTASGSSAFVTVIIDFMLVKKD